MKANYRFKFLLVLACVVMATKAVHAQQYIERNMLGKALSGDRLNTLVAGIPEWRAAKFNEVTTLMAQLPDSVKTGLVAQAQKNMDFDWPSLPASSYMEFAVNGNRDRFQKKYSDRRKILYNFVMAELVEQKGRFIPQIANGLWAICEESTWCYPAHISAQGKVGLPDPAQQIVDLGAGETAINLSWAVFMLKAQLDKQVSPIISQRVLLELNKRILQPCLTRDFWWMGFPRKKVNNWNVWINKNWLYTLALTTTDTDLLTKSIARLTNSADNFINSYAEDGGCEEGSHYWDAAPGYLSQLLGLLKEVSKGGIDLGKEQLIVNMGEYIYKLHIGGRQFVNFADAHTQPDLNIATIYRFGNYINNKKMMGFAAFLKNQEGNKARLGSGSIHDLFYQLEISKALSETKGEAPLPKDSWLPDLQVATLRTQGGSTKGLFIAIKGGYNGVSHGHNDAGNFILYVDGKPAIIDAGVGTYTAQTFGSGRYKIWSMRSTYHNLPLINGEEQKAGVEYKAEHVTFTKPGGTYIFSADIAKAYPAAAQVNSWVRELIIPVAGTTATLKENFELKKTIKPYELSLMTPLKVNTSNKGRILLQGEHDANMLEITYQPDVMTIKVEEVDFEGDLTMKREWPNGLRRIILTGTQQAVKGAYQLLFKTAK